MKTMTCRQLGGPCDLALSGDTADDVIQQQDRHLKEMAATGDEAHAPAAKEMKGRWRRPVPGARADWCAGLAAAPGAVDLSASPSPAAEPLGREGARRRRWQCSYVPGLKWYNATKKAFADLPED